MNDDHVCDEIIEGYQRNAKAKIYYDAEFTGLHRDTTLISIGFVGTRGNRFYAEFNDYDKRQVNEWLQVNVIDKLRFNNVSTCITAYDQPAGVHNIQMKSNSGEIRKKLLQWLTDEHQSYGGQVPIQIYTDCYAYDWMLLVHLLTNGLSALDMPDFIYYIPIDLSTSLHEHNYDPDINRELFASLNLCDKHNSLNDAQVIKECFNRLEKERVTKYNEV
jgi:hypothetical protein